MQDMIDGDMDKRKIWAKVLESRQKKGLPYIFFTDNVNQNKPQVYKDSGACQLTQVICVQKLCCLLLQTKVLSAVFLL